ncbi:hypothetical protein HKX48_000590 [Thoreauomyces humboldtii]|nr:hypothetical protein HKX48_000590 [Thoreauomyces humboldtii]
MGLQTLPSAVDVVVKDDPQPISRNIFSYFTYTWVTPVLWKGWKRPLQEEDLPTVPVTKTSSALAISLDLFWDRMKAHAADPSVPKPSFLRLLQLRFWKLWLASFIADAMVVAIALLMPLLIGDVLNVLAPTSGNSNLIGNIYAYAFLYFAMAIIRALANFGTKSIGLDMILQSRAMLIAAIYQKSLRISPSSRGDFTAGRINTLVDVDVSSVTHIPENVNGVVLSITQIALGLYLIARVLGISTWISVGVYFGLALFVVVTLPFVGKGQQKYLSVLDERTTLLREFLYSIKVLKMGNLERRFSERISTVRTAQLAALVRFMIPISAMFFFMAAQTVLLPTITIVGLDKVGGGLKAERIFPILGLLAALTGPSAALGGFVGGIIQLLPSVNRVNAFLAAPEASVHEVTEVIGRDISDDGKSAVQMDGASFAWPKSIESEKAATVEKQTDAEPAPITPTSNALSDVTLSIPRGTLTVVLGSVGSGKSAFLAALAGSVTKVAGSSRINGSVAYCEQTPWLISGTVQDNICGLFTKAATTDDAFRAARSVCLDKDLEVLPNGLGTRVGENNGVKLSGGQRARVALARAIASEADVLLLDDVLASLDPNVGGTIFQRTLREELSDRTILLATSQAQYAAQADLVVVLDKGRVAESGTYRTLLADPTSRLSLLLQSHNPDENSALATVLSTKTVTLTDEKQQALVKEAREAVTAYEEEKQIAEDRVEGVVASATYRRFLAASTTWCVALYAVFWPICVALAAWQMIALVERTATTTASDEKRYFTIYWGAGIARMGVKVVVEAVAFVSCYRAAKTYHERALAGLLKAPISWFDGQPVGRILNRLTADVKALDCDFAILASMVFDITQGFMTSVVILAYTTPYMLILFVVLLVPALAMYRFFQTSYRELKRLDSILQSPAASHLTESLNGISTINAFSSGDRFLSRQHSLSDRRNKSVFILASAIMWLSLRLQVLAGFVILLTLLLAGAGVVSPGAVGLALVSSISLGEDFMNLLLMLSAVETSFNSAERLDHYAYDLPLEIDRPDPENLSGDWPLTGTVEIKDLEIRYGDATGEPVVKGLSLSVASGEKLAICGRTGAGKSTLVLTLFRIVDPTNGTILIDGIDISTLSLATVRSKLTIIPQEPLLLSGTIRDNLDVAGSHTDEAIWSALALMHMKEHVASLPGLLDAPVSDGGNVSILSTGQRQLLFLTRAALEKPKILVMDEASSAIDPATDKAIMASLLSTFPATTVICIAHRPSSVARFDTVAVLEAGRLVEVDTPARLLRRDGSAFAAMVDALGEGEAGQVKAAAFEKEQAIAA